MNLCRTIFGVVTGLALCVLGVVYSADAQVISNEYEISIQNRQYVPQAGFGMEIPRENFIDIFNSFVNADDGVAGPYNLGFTFEYDNQLFTQIYISVNGWASFEARFITNDPYTLFSANNGPNQTLAPFFGDHYFRAPGYDTQDPQGRNFTPTYIRYIQKPGTADPANRGRKAFVVEWENLNINYFFDPTDPDNPFSPDREPQAPSIASFQLWIFQADSTSPSQRGTIEFHYGPAGTGGGTSLVKFSGSSVGIEDAPAVPNGNTSYINAVAYQESGRDIDVATSDTRLSSTWPPTGFPGRAFVFSGDTARGIDGWGDGDANLTQVDNNVPQFIRDNQRRFVSFADVIRILRHQATRGVDFSYNKGRHGYHGDVNHNGRFYYSTQTGPFGNQIQVKVLFPTKSLNPDLPFPNDNTFNGFLFDADELDAALILNYLGAKLPVLPWLPDTLPPFTGKVVPGAIASDIRMQASQIVSGSTVEIPILLNGRLEGAMGIALEVAEGVRIVGIETAGKTDTRWVEAIAAEDRVSIAASGAINQGDVIATLIVEIPENGVVNFDNVKVNGENKGARKLNLFNAGTGEAAGLHIGANYPNPFTPNTVTEFAYNVPYDGPVNVRVYDVLGRAIKTLVNANLVTGTYSANWNGLDEQGIPVESGIYYCRIESNGESRVISMQVQK